MGGGMLGCSICMRLQWLQGHVFNYVSGGGRLLAKSPKPSCVHLVWGAQMETIVAGNGVRWWLWGHVFNCASGGSRLLGPKPQTDCVHLVLGVVLKMVMVGNGGRWWGAAYEVTMVRGHTFDCVSD
jgi:hypothetical protein